MSLRKVQLVPGEYYHIYNRGNSKQTIFQDKWDYDRFVKLLFLSNGQASFKTYLAGSEIYNFDRGKQLVHMGAYCLMPNHFHLLLTQTEDGGISKFMQKLSTGYSMYYNQKHERTGSLFEGKFKSEHADNDTYLKHLFSYIHLNPVKIIDSNWKENGLKDKQKVLKFLEQYQFSSYQGSLGYNRKQNLIINREAFPDYFPTPPAFREAIFSWLNVNLQARPVQVLPV